jgi:hypothetical protein
MHVINTKTHLGGQIHCHARTYIRPQTARGRARWPMFATASDEWSGPRRRGSQRRTAEGVAKTGNHGTEGSRADMLRVTTFAGGSRSGQIVGATTAGDQVGAGDHGGCGTLGFSYCG